MTHAVRAFGEGMWAVVRAPILLAAVALATLLVAMPFGLVLGQRVQTSLANQPPLAAGGGEIDPDWWAEFRNHASGLEATFTPTVIGFAAPLDNLSAVLDGTARPIALAGPIALAVVLWAFLWGGLMDRFVRGRAAGPRGFLAAGWRHFSRFAIISLASGVVILVLYLTVHAVLFGPVYTWLAGRADSEPLAFLWRIGLYVIFGGLIAVVGLVADYARVSVVVSDGRSAREAIRLGATFVRRHFSTVLTLYVLTGTMFVAVLAAYGVLDIYGGSRVGGWRAIVLGQAYILARLAIRLMVAASEVALFRSVGDHVRVGMRKAPAE